jgi:hypothetical protein
MMLLYKRKAMYLVWHEKGDGQLILSIKFKFLTKDIRTEYCLGVIGNCFQGCRIIFMSHLKDTVQYGFISKEEIEELLDTPDFFLEFIRIHMLLFIKLKEARLIF